MAQPDFEDGSYLDVAFEDVTVRLHRFNTALYTFWGANSMYDHVYVDLEEHEVPESPEGGVELRVFSNETGYAELVDYIEAHQWPRLLNQVVIASRDIEAFYEKQMLYIQNGLGESPGGNSVN